MKAYTFRLYPTAVQIEKLDWQLARCCELYNAALQREKMPGMRVRVMATFTIQRGAKSTQRSIR